MAAAAAGEARDQETAEGCNQAERRAGCLAVETAAAEEAAHRTQQKLAKVGAAGAERRVANEPRN